MVCFVVATALCADSTRLEDEDAGAAFDALVDEAALRSGFVGVARRGLN
jgi:hypothetical protein